AGFVLYQDRIRTIYQAGGLQSAQRIAEIVHLLEDHASDEREQFIRALNTRFLRISLNSNAWDGVNITGMDDKLAAMFETILRRNLGNDRSMQVGVTPTHGLPDTVPGPGWQGRGSGMGMGMGRRHRMAEMGMSPGKGLYFLARIQLQDGAWVTFDHRVPEQSADWPWRLLLTAAILLVAVVT
ncbi:MAG: hypothetical protein GY731_17530, partial [Gammaproteobacteria bacterium]|nr:hypothetical protein [Gammaproteobacteria bacterium]